MFSWPNDLILKFHIFHLINAISFRHLKLDIALAIPALNDE